MSITIVALQMVSISFAGERAGESFLAGGSSAGGVMPATLTSNSWLIDQTAFGASKRSRKVVELRQNESGTPITLVQSGSLPPEPSAIPSPIYQPFPVTEPIPGTVIPWNQAPAAPQFSFCDDFHNLPKRLGSDVRVLASWDNALFLGSAAGIALVLHDNVDNRVRDDTLLHGPRWGEFSEVFSHGGDAWYVHIPLLATMYATSLWQQNEDLHELTLTMFTSFKFAVISSLALQYATDTHHTEGGFINFFRDSGFPSASTATSFALAAVIDERFGWKGGLPAYLVSGLIGWSEIDVNHHTVSEVFFGAALGYAIGKTIGATRYRPNDPFKLVPFVDGYTGAQGIGFEYRY